MTADQLAALDPEAAAYIRAITRDGITGALAAHGDPNPAATLTAIQREVTARLPRITDPAATQAA